MPHHYGCEAAQTVPSAGRIMGPLVIGVSIMKLIFCVALAVASCFADAGVNKCVDQEGRVLFTDVECPVVKDQVKEPEPAVEAPVLVPALAAVAPAAPRSRWADLPRLLIRKPVSIDTRTLLAARQHMLVQDELYKSRRLISSR